MCGSHTCWQNDCRRLTDRAARCPPACSHVQISPFERDFQLYANKDKSKAFQRAVKEAQHFIATGGPRLGQLPPAMMPESADLMMYPQHSLQPSEVRYIR